MSIFNEETSQEDLMRFVHSLPTNQIKYSGVMKIYSDYVSHEIYSQNYQIEFPQRYFQAKRKRKQNSQKEVKPVLKIKPEMKQDDENKNKRAVWSEKEVRAMSEGIKKYGVGNWNQIYEANKELFMNINVTPKKIKAKYMACRDTGIFN